MWNDTEELKRRTRTLESVGVYRYAIFDLAGDQGATPEALYGLKVTASLFPTLGVSPMIGRNILPEEDQPGRPEVMILSYGLWTRRFHSDRAIVGRTVTVEGHDCLVIGVMPPDFNFPMRRTAAHTPSPYVEFWAPLSNSPGAKQGGMGAVARLRKGVSIAAARQDLAGISDVLAREFPATNRDKILTLNFLRDRVLGSASNSLMLLLAASVLFMLIGCANVANLLLARGFSRQREISVRAALGAGRIRIVRQLLTESCVLALLGAVGGYALAAVAWKILPAVAPVSIPRLAAARADGSIFGFTLALAMINGILFGIAPALRLAGTGEALALGSRGAAAGRRDRIRSALVIAEVALSVMLVVAGGEVLSSFVKLMRTDPGFDADHVLASVVLPSPVRYPVPAQRALFFERILNAVRALPGVESAGVVDALPFSGENTGGFVGNGGVPLEAEIDVIGGEYLQTMGVRLLAGRWFRHDDDAGDAAIVNEFTAARLWPQGSAVGQRICVFCSPEQPDNWKRVVGVVSGMNHGSLSESKTGDAVYLAAGAMQHADFVVVRTARPTGDLEQAIRLAIAAIDPNQPVFLSATMRALLKDSVADRWFITTLLAITGGLALLLSASGVYGVVAYTTVRRTQEIGIRMALGATPGDVRALLFREGFRTIAAGLALGLCAALSLTSVLRSAFVGLQSPAAPYLWIATAPVTLTAAAACWLPIRRITRIDPMSALRQE
jgi:putative ABC transport system permease protein